MTLKKITLAQIAQALEAGLIQQGLDPGVSMESGYIILRVSGYTARRLSMDTFEEWP